MRAFLATLGTLDDLAAAQSRGLEEQIADVTSRGALKLGSNCCNMQGQIIFRRCVLEDSAVPDRELMWHGGDAVAPRCFHITITARL